MKWGVSFGVDKVSLDDGLGRGETPMFERKNRERPHFYVSLLLVYLGYGSLSAFSVILAHVIHIEQT